MTEEIIEMARQAGIRDCTCSGEFGCLEAFVKLVRDDALAQPEQEPVGLAHHIIGCFSAATAEGLTEALANTTDKHLADLVNRRLMYALYAAQEATTPPQPAQQEPWSDERAYHEGRADYEASVRYFVKARHPLFEELTKIQQARWVANAAKRLYTTPPAAQRQWLGLTDKEILSDDTLRYYYGMNGGAGPVSQKGKRVVAAIEAKLKEKNT